MKTKDDLLLAIDIGNTNIVFGVNYKGEWIKHWRIQTDHLKTADEYEVIFRALINAGKLDRRKINNIVLSSVVPSLVRPFENMLNRVFDNAALAIINPDVYDYLPLKILNPYEMGTDLVANAVAAYEKFGNFTTVIDFGTALTFTTIGENAEVLGVAIAPGLQTAMVALAGKTAQLPQVHLASPPSVLGKNTVHAIQSGIIFGFTGLVDSMIERTQNELENELTVVATGGLSSLIAPLTKNKLYIDTMLTLNGLVSIGEYIQKRG